MQLLAGSTPRRATVLSGSSRPFKRKFHSRLGTAANLTSTTQRSELHQLFSVAVAALSPGSNRGAFDAPGIAKPVKEAEKRVLRLEQLLCLRRLYRNIVRAEAYHRTAAHVYTPFTDAEYSEFATDEDLQEDREARRSDALDILADMAVVREQIQADIKELLPHTALLFAPPGATVAPSNPLDPGVAPGSGQQARSDVLGASSAFTGDATTATDRHAAELAADLDALASSAVTKLRERGDRELDRLAAAFDYQPQVKILAREVQSRAVQMGSGLSVGARTPTKYLKGTAPTRAPVAAARDFVKQSGVKAAFRASRSYVTDFWARINGLRLSTATESLPFGMPTPCGRAGVIWPRVQALQERITDLERALKDSSKAREQRVRRAPLELRATMAYEMQDMDRDVLRVGRELALCTLDVQLDALYLCLEEEVRQILDVEAGSEITGQEPAAELAQAAQRRGSTEELSVLIAQYSLLVRRQASLRDVFQRQEQRLALLMPAFDEEVRSLAGQISESRLRVGIPDQDVFGGTGFSMRKLQLQTRDAAVSVQEGVDFFVLGVRMLFTDCGYSGRLFGRATFGATLKAREVSALRRTLKDILTFVPFIIILIIPMTPLGHVLVFGFIQRYFPDFFPSQFNQRRQEMVKTYEDLRQRLQVAQAAANHEEDQENLQQAAAAIARLTPPSVPVVLDQAQGRASGSGMMTTILPNGVSSAPEQLKELRKRVEQAGFEAMNFGSESEDEDSSTNTLPDSWKIR